MTNIVDRVLEKHDRSAAEAIAKLGPQHPEYSSRVGRIKASSVRAKIADLKVLKTNSLRIKSHEAKQVGQAATAWLEKLGSSYEKRLDKALEKATKLLDQSSISDDLRQFEVASDGLEVMFKASGISAPVGWASDPQKAHQMARSLQAQMMRIEGVRVGKLRAEVRDVREHLRQVPAGLTTVQDHERTYYVKAA